MKRSEIESKVSDLIKSRIEAGEPVQMTWAVHETIISMGEITGDGEDFYKFAAYNFLPAIVKKALGKFDNPADAEPGEQMMLSGYEYVQRAYSVPRDGDSMLVPVELLTDEEIDARCKDLYRTAHGCLEHAKELQKYKTIRKAADDVMAELTGTAP